MKLESIEPAIELSPVAVSPRRPGPALLYALLVFMVLCWSLNFVIARFALREMPSLLAASIRTLIAAALLLPVYLWRGRREDRAGWIRRDVWKLLALGVCGVTLNQAFFLTGLERTSTAHAAILIGLTPIQVLLYSALLRLERLSLRRGLGMLVALGGIAVLQFSRGGKGEATLAGDLMVLVAGGMFALFTVFGKRITLHHGALTVNTFAYGGGAIMLLPFFFRYAFSFDFTRVSLTAWLAILYMAIFPAVIGYLILYYALTFVSASRVSALAYLQPLLATMFGVLWLGDTISGGLVAGGALVLAGVYLTERR